MIESQNNNESTNKFQINSEEKNLIENIKTTPDISEITNIQESIEISDEENKKIVDTLKSINDGKKDNSKFFGKDFKEIRSISKQGNMYNLKTINDYSINSKGQKIPKNGGIGPEFTVTGPEGQIFCRENGKFYDDDYNDKGKNIISILENSQNNNIAQN